MAAGASTAAEQGDDEAQILAAVALTEMAGGPSPVKAGGSSGAACCTPKKEAACAWDGAPRCLPPCRRCDLLSPLLPPSCSNSVQAPHGEHVCAGRRR